MRKSILLLAVVLLAGIKVKAQTTTLPFLLIPSDARAGGMGDIGVATSSDAYSLYHNPSKIAFNESQLSAGVSYVPWLRNLTDDIFAGNLSLVNRFSQKSAWGVDIKYFSLGQIDLTDEQGNLTGTINPNEFSISGYYSMKLSEAFSMGVGLKFLNSDLDVSNQNGFDVVRGFGVDISGYYQSTEENYGNFNGRYRLGFNIANIGPKVEYVAGEPNFIPTNLKLGGGFDFILDDYNNIGVNLEFRKLLVPADANSEDGWFDGMFTSFTDSQELKEVVWSLGAEYLYNDAFAVRAGYFHESEEEGNRQYLTLGAGFQAKAFSLDLSYLVNTSDVNNPLESTLRFSLAFDLGTIYEDY